MKITSKEIAEIANVSRSTVSRVINNYPNVPEQTRQKVERVIQEYGYMPNTSARTLAGKHNNIISLFIADIKDYENENSNWNGVNSPYFLTLIAETIKASKKMGYMVLVNIITDKAEYEEIEHMFLNRTIFGGIFVGFKYQTKEIKSLIKKEYNMVFVDQIRGKRLNKNIKTVNSKNIEGAYNATKYLIENGHKHIAHISGDDRLSSIDRKQGYIKAINDFNVENKYLYEGLYNEEIAYDKTKEILKNKDISAIFVANDIMAQGSIRAIRDEKLNIPDDISIIGFDNLKIKNYFDIELTTMDISIKNIAQNAVKLIIEDNKYKNIECEAKLIEGNSVKKGYNFT